MVKTKKSDIFDRVKSEELEYLQRTKGQKIKPCEAPLYKVVSRDGYKSKKMEGGFVQFLPMLVSTLGPMVLDYAIKKWSGGGIVYKKQVGRNEYEDLDNTDKKYLLYKILQNHPELVNEIFK